MLKFMRAMSQMKTATSWSIELGDDYDGNGILPFLTDTISPSLEVVGDLILPVLGRQHISFEWDIWQYDPYNTLPQHEIYRIIATPERGGLVNCTARGAVWETFDPNTITAAELKDIAANAGMTGVNAYEVYVIKSSVSNDFNAAWDIVFADQTTSSDVDFECGNAQVSRIQNANVMQNPSGEFTLDIYDSYSGTTVRTGNIDVQADAITTQSIVDAAVPGVIDVTIGSTGSTVSIEFLFIGGDCLIAPESHTCGDVPMMHINNVNLSGTAISYSVSETRAGSEVSGTMVWGLAEKKVNISVGSSASVMIESLKGILPTKDLNVSVEGPLLGELFATIFHTPTAAP